MPLLKAFHLLFRTMAKKKGMSSIELATEVGAQQKTAWHFKLIIKDAIIQESKKKLTGLVQVDETLIGGYSEGNVGRSLEQKTAVLVTSEELPDGRTGNIQMKVIENFTKVTLEVNIDEMIDKSATLKTDKFFVAPFNPVVPCEPVAPFKPVGPCVPCGSTLLFTAYNT